MYPPGIFDQSKVESVPESDEDDHKTGYVFGEIGRKQLAAAHYRLGYSKFWNWEFKGSSNLRCRTQLHHNRILFILTLAIHCKILWV